MEAATRGIETLQTVRDYIRWGASRFNEAGLFFGHGTDNAWDEAVFLVLNAIHLPWESDNRILDARLTTPEKECICALFDRRVNDRTPAAYLVGEAWFAGLMFKVDERVLIPRSPIAELIEQQFEPWLPREPQRILDLCTGSGCIGIACAMVFPEALVDLSDISSDALAVAAENIARHHLSGRVHAVQSDLFAAFAQAPGADARTADVPAAGKGYDLIVSNPPYVDAEEFAAMPAEYRHEPELALVSGEDGLDFTRRLLREAPDYLTEQGILVVEVGYSEAAMARAFPDLPLIWLEFERGGSGVFVISRKELVAAAEQGVL